MVDAKEFIEGRYVTPKLVNNSPTKKCVIITEPVGEVTKYSDNQLVCVVQIDKKMKTWQINIETAENLSTKYGTETQNWVNKVVNLKVVSISGKPLTSGARGKVVGTPE